MQSIIEGFAAAFRLIITLNPELLRIILLSLQVSGTALILATVLGLPVGAFLALGRVPLRGLVISLLNTGMGLPPVAAGYSSTCFCPAAVLWGSWACSTPPPP